MRILGAILTAVFGLPFLFFCLTVLSSRFGAAEDDPHGYGMVFGTLLALVVSVPLALSLPLALPAGDRARAMSVTVVVLLVANAGLFACLLTA